MHKKNESVIVLIFFLFFVLLKLQADSITQVNGFMGSKIVFMSDNSTDPSIRRLRCCYVRRQLCRDVVPPMHTLNFFPHRTEIISCAVRFPLFSYISVMLLFLNDCLRLSCSAGN